MYCPLAEPTFLVTATRCQYHGVVGIWRGRYTYPIGYLHPWIPTPQPLGYLPLGCLPLCIPTPLGYLPPLLIPTPSLIPTPGYLSPLGTYLPWYLTPPLPRRAMRPKIPTRPEGTWDQRYVPSPLPMDRMTDRHLWKITFPTTTVVGSDNVDLDLT